MTADLEGPMFCEVRYRLNPDKMDDFADYGRAWIRLIERHGGTHNGFFLPRAAPGDQTLSFPGLGQAGAADESIALFGFPNEAAYRRYRTDVPLDPEGAAVIARFVDPPFVSYERIFLRPLTTDVQDER